MTHRAIFLFHIWKTGGTSIAATFRRALGPRSLLNIEGRDFGTLSKRIESLSGSHGTKLFYGHVPPLFVNTPPEMIRTVVVREPLDCIISQFCFSYSNRHLLPRDFEFFRRRAGNQKNKFSVEDVEKMILEKENDNLQTRFMAWHWGAPVTEDTLATAKRALDSCEVVGVTDQLDLYLALLSALAGMRFDSAVRTNRTSKDILDSNQTRLREKIAPYFKFDAELYTYAKARFEESFAKHDGELIIPRILHTVETVKLALRDRIVIWRQASSRELWGRIQQRLRQLVNVARDV